MAYLAEYTDTFGGEANYCWVHRAEIDAPNAKVALRRARKQFGLTGIRGDIIDDYGDGISWKPRGMHRIVMVNWSY